MRGGPVSLQVSGEDAGRLAGRLTPLVKGDVRFDRLARTLYATDASIYEIVPVGVVMPKDGADVAAVINECRQAGVSIIPRGGGTGLAGGAVGYGVQLDLSRYMNRIGALDLDARTVEVEPGVVLDELNAYLAPHGLQFAPDVATSSRATIGGMIANNSCGTHSIVYGRTVDHVAELTVVLSDGQTALFSALPTGNVSSPSSGQATEYVRAAEIQVQLAGIRDAHFDEIKLRFPKVMRSNGGYGLDRLGPPGTPAAAIEVLCGSEGTLGVIVRAKLHLVSIPKYTALVVLHFESLLRSLAAVPDVLRHRPAAVELIDRLIIDAGRSNPAIQRQCGFIQGNPEALLVVEFFADHAEDLPPKLETMVGAASSLGAYAAATIVDRSTQADVWKLRTSGLGLLMSRPGDAQPYSFIEDAAVDPSRLGDYIGRLAAVLDGEGVHAGYYAHASVGVLHVKPVLNLKLAEDVERMRRIAESAASLALEFGGAVTGEHGDGIVRSCWIEKTYGPKLVEAFRQVKRLFDPDNLMNPHKIVDPWPMTDHLRYGPAFREKNITTHLDFSAHGGMAGHAQMCSGVGQCRQRLVGTMCPSYMATGDETHTTRGRANALRVALSNRGMLDGLDDAALGETMDLCLSCKACKTECPTGVDMARLKAEYLAQRVLRHGASRRARLIADMPGRLEAASRFPAMANWIARRGVFRRLLERCFGIDRRIPPPKLARQTFRAWFHRNRSHRKRASGDIRPRVVYLVDTWTNFFTPQVGIAAVRVLERAGFHVLCPHTLCCGRPAISQGLLADARQAAEANVELLAPLAQAGIPIVGTEPSCTLTYVDEYPQLVRTPAARCVAAQSQTIEAFLRRVFDDRPDACSLAAAGSVAKAAEPARVLYHAHCHQKALVGSGDAAELLRRVFGERASEINSGCCGMAGAFGHEMEHYDVARAVGEQRLFPAVRSQPDAAVAVSGFSCRCQIEHHTGRRPLHVVELLAAAMT